MALNEYDKKHMTEQEQDYMEFLTEQWNMANASGDKETMDLIHKLAEQERAKYNYTGGEWGNAPETLIKKVTGDTESTTPRKDIISGEKVEKIADIGIKAFIIILVIGLIFKVVTK